MRVLMNLTRAGRVYGGADGSQEKNDHCIYTTPSHCLCKFFAVIISTRNVRSDLMFNVVKNISANICFGIKRKANVHLITFHITEI